MGRTARITTQSGRYTSPAKAAIGAPHTPDRPDRLAQDRMPSLYNDADKAEVVARQRAAAGHLPARLTGAICWPIMVGYA